MLEFLKKRIKNEKGLSLVELLAVIVILGIVAAIAIPAIGNIIENSRYNGAKSDAINVLNAANIYFTDNADEPTVTVKTLSDDGYLESSGKLEEGAEVTKASGGNTISATIEFSKGKTLTITGATLADINGDDTKGSSSDTISIP